MSTTAPEARARPSGVRWGTLLTGCAIGCASLVALAVVATVLVWQWAARGTPLPAEDALLDASVVGYMTVSVNPEDEAMLEFLREFESSAGQDQRILTKALPLRLAASMSRAGDRIDWAGVLSLSRYANLLRLPFLPFAFTDEGTKGVTVHRGERILADQDGKSEGAFVLVGGNFVLASSIDTAKRVIDRLHEEQPGEGLAELQALWPAGEDVPIKGAILNRSGELELLLTALGLLPAPVRVEAPPPPPPPPSGPEAPEPPSPVAAELRLSRLPPSLAEVTGATLRLRAGSPAPDAVEGSLTFTYAGGVEAHAEELRGVGPLAASRLRAQGLDPHASLRVEGNRIVIEGRLGGVVEALRKGKLSLGHIHIQ